MKIILERHMYAPELNVAYVGPTRTRMAAPGCTTIKQVRAKLFSPLKHTGRYVTLRAENQPQYAGCNRTRQGFCNDMRSLKGALKVFKAYHNLPDCKHVIKTRLIG